MAENIYGIVEKGTQGGGRKNGKQTKNKANKTRENDLLIRLIFPLAGYNV